MQCGAGAGANTTRKISLPRPVANCLYRLCRLYCLQLEALLNGEGQPPAKRQRVPPARVGSRLHLSSVSQQAGGLAGAAAANTTGHRGGPAGAAAAAAGQQQPMSPRGGTGLSPFAPGAAVHTSQGTGAAGPAPSTTTVTTGPSISQGPGLHHHHHHQHHHHHAHHHASHQQPEASGPSSSGGAMQVDSPATAAGPSSGGAAAGTGSGGGQGPGGSGAAAAGAAAGGGASGGGAPSTVPAPSSRHTGAFTGQGHGGLTSPRAVGIAPVPSSGVPGAGAGAAAAVAGSGEGDQAAAKAAAAEKWQRIQGQHCDVLQKVYLERRAAACKQGGAGGGAGAAKAAGRPGLGGGAGAAAHGAAAAAAGAAGNATPGSASPNATTTTNSGSTIDLSSLPSHLSSLADDLSHFARYERLETLASLRYGGAQLSTQHMVCCVAFDRDDAFFATAGVSKRIRIYELAGVVDGAAALGGAESCGAFPVLELTSRSRLSSVCWSAYIKGHLAASDYDGVVALWDANTNTELLQLEEHAKRVWSVDFSRLDPTRLASASDDGTVRVWSINAEASVARLECKVGRPRALCIQTLSSAPVTRDGACPRFSRPPAS